MPKDTLGKGLGALIKKSKTGAPAADIDEGSVRHVPLDSVVPSPLQPRSNIASEQLEELIKSIEQHGVIQPLIVRPVEGKLELIAGERRWRACSKLNLETVPVIEREATDREVLEMALIENLQRQDLNPIEEATGYVRLATEFDLKQDEIATRVGKARASVANAMRLLDLHKDVQKFVADGLITVGHAKAILGIKEKKAQRAAADEVLRRKLTVRATERLVQDFHRSPVAKKTRKTASSLDGEAQAQIDSLVSKLRTRFATQVNIHHSPKRGRIELEYYGDDDLQRLLELMGVDLDEL